MIRHILTLSALIAAVLLVRAVFKSRVPKRMIYCLWLVVLLKLCLPGVQLALPLLPAAETAAPVQRAELPAPTAPAAQPVVQPQAAARPATQGRAEPAAKPLTAAQIVRIIWAAGSALLGLWMLGSWLVFTVRLRRSRRFLGKHGRVSIFVSDSIQSPCLAGMLPAVYLTQSVLQDDTTELILRHELTHLRHLDPLWSLCRTAAVAVYWWNPLVWLAAILSKRDAELACDEAVAAGLDAAQRLAYARAILAQAPRKAAALSLAGPPVRERILFLTKKQRTSAVCVVLALLLVVSATGCSFAELTQQKAGTITLPEASAISEGNDVPTVRDKAETDAKTVLTQAQIDAVNDAFVCDRADGDETLGHFAVNGFFTSTYGDVRDLDLNSFLDSFGECSEDDISEEEFSQLNAKWNFNVASAADFPLPIHRYPASAVEGVLRRFAGIGLADLKDIQEPFSGYTYLEDTDAFYTTTSDYSPGYFICTDGELDAAGGSVQLFGNTLGRFPGEAVLRLRKNGENWYIQSFTVTDATMQYDDIRRWSWASYDTPDSALPYDEIWSLVHEKLDSARWAQDMTPEYEKAVRAFQLADSKTSDDPGDVSQWPRYYSAFVDSFSGANTDLSYLDEDTLWTMDLSGDGQTLIVTMTRADAVSTCSYSLQSSQITQISTRRTVVIQNLTDTSVTVEHITLLNSFLAEDLQILEDLNIPPEEYQDGYYRKDSGEAYTYKADPNASVTVYDLSQEYGAGEDRLYTFETWKDFVSAAGANESPLIQPYTLTIQNGVVTEIVEKFYN